MSDLVLVKLNKRFNQLGAGEVGGYDQATAEQLVKDGAGVIVQPEPEKPKPEVPVALAGELKKAEAAFSKSGDAFKAAEREHLTAGARVAEIQARIEKAMNPAAPIFLVRLRKRFGSLNGEVRGPRGELIRKGEIGGYDEKTMRMLTEPKRNHQTGEQAEPLGDLVAQEEADAENAHVATPSDEGFVLVRLNKRFNQLGAGEVGGYDRKTAARLTTPRVLPDGRQEVDGVLVDPEIYETPAAVAATPQTVDPALDVVNLDPAKRAEMDDAAAAKAKADAEATPKDSRRR